MASPEYQHIDPDGGAMAPDAVASHAEAALRLLPCEGKRVLFIIPDTTRSMPMPSVFRAAVNAVRGRASQISVLIALGTHPPMSREAIARHLGATVEQLESEFADVAIHNHAWDDPAQLASLGELSADRVAELTEGRMAEAVEVKINRRVLEHDLLCVCGPVFPHEVVGFSGGNKYFFPGVSGPEILNLFHWLGALITNYAIIGTKHTPVRAVVDAAAAMIPVEKRCLALTVKGPETRALFYGKPEAAWAAAADLSEATHIVRKPHPYHSVLAIAPAMYEDIWVAGKCMYKTEPVIADGGELIIYAPHVKEVSVTHGALIRHIGYHVRDYFVKQADRFADIPGGILAHSTHVRGAGEYENGIETPRVQVTLATGIDEATCRAINLGYRDPATIDIEAWRNREDQGLLLVEKAGEILYRLESETNA
jgi:nickel-dependent lactate racemase